MSEINYYDASCKIFEAYLNKEEYKSRNGYIKVQRAYEDFIKNVPIQNIKSLQDYFNYFETVKLNFSGIFFDGSTFKTIVVKYLDFLEFEIKRLEKSTPVLNEADKKTRQEKVNALLEIFPPGSDDRISFQKILKLPEAIKKDENPADTSSPDEVTALKSKLQTLEQQHQETLAALQKAKTENDSLTQFSEKQVKMTTESVAGWEATKQEMDALEAEKAKLISEVNILREENKILQDKIQGNNRAFEINAKEITRLKNTITALTTELQATKAALEAKEREDKEDPFDAAMNVFGAFLTPAADLHREESGSKPTPAILQAQQQLEETRRRNPLITPAT